MASKKDSKKKGGLISTNKTVAENKRARFDYTLEDKFEAGIMLTGTEVKSLRHGQASIVEAYIGPQKDMDGLYIHNATIPEYQQASEHLQHDPTRLRKLLLHKRELDKLLGSIARGGYTIVPLRLYFDSRGMVKLELALAKGKKSHDKRQATKDRDWKRDKARIMKHNN